MFCSILQASTLGDTVTRKVPSWAIAGFRRFLNYVEESDRILHLSMKGISGLQGIPRLIKAIAKVEEDKEPDAQQIERARKEADFAKREIERGFPLLHAYTIVALWGAMEALLEDVLIAWMMNDPTILKKEIFSKPRISLSDFEGLERDERMLLLVRELERTLVANRKRGAERFEMLLDPLGLSGPIEENIKRDIYEMHQVRNVLVHRAGVADRRLVEGCPWLRLKVGDPVIVTHDCYLRYQNALSSYVTDLVYRVGTHFGVDLRARSKDAESQTE